MVVTNEPGFYKEGEYGIRIENIMIVKDDPLHSDFLCFENITRVPYDRRLIDKTLLTSE